MASWGDLRLIEPIYDQTPFTLLSFYRKKNMLVQIHSSYMNFCFINFYFGLINNWSLNSNFQLQLFLKHYCVEDITLYCKLQHLLQIQHSTHEHLSSVRTFLFVCFFPSDFTQCGLMCKYSICSEEGSADLDECCGINRSV